MSEKILEYLRLLHWLENLQGSVWVENQYAIGFLKRDLWDALGTNVRARP